MKKALTLTLTLASLALFAQEISTKKGKVLFDNKEVASVQKEKKNFILSSLDNSSRYNFLKSDERLTNGNFALIYEVTDLKSNKKNYLVFPNPKRSLNGDKILAENITLTYGFLTPDGIAVDKINSFLDSEVITPDVQIKEINAKINQQISDSKKKFKENNLVIGPGWSINKIIDGEEVKVGYLVKNKKGNLEYHFEVYKIDPYTKANTKIGIWSNSGETVNFENKRDFLSERLKTINGEEIYVEAEFGDIDKNSLKDSKTAQLIMYYMTGFGYFD